MQDINPDSAQKLTGKSAEELAEKFKENLQPNPQEVSPEIKAKIQALMGSEIGTNLMAILGQIGMMDTNPGNVKYHLVRTVPALDVMVGVMMLDPELMKCLRMLMWSNRMAYHFDGSSPQLYVIVRWFLSENFLEDEAEVSEAKNKDEAHAE